jgi:hypothetical protein
MKKLTLVIAFISVIVTVGCKKKSSTTAGVDPRVPPDLVLKTGGNYVSKDTTVVKQDTLLIGVVVTKTEDNLTSFNASYSVDGASTTTTFFNHQLFSTEYLGYSKDLFYYTRNQAGTEKLTFSIVDRDGNITKKSILITVQ